MCAIHVYNIEYPIVCHELVQIVYKNSYFYRASQLLLVSFSASISIMEMSWSCCLAKYSDTFYEPLSNTLSYAVTPAII